MTRICVVCLAWLSLMGPALSAEKALISMTARGSILASTPQDGSARHSLVAFPNNNRPPEDYSRSGSLFIGEKKGSLTAPYPKRPDTLNIPAPPSPNASIRDMVRHIIASAEAGSAGYDAVVYSATVRPSKQPSLMTLSEIFQWIRATPNQNHAIGRYQFIPSTLKRLVSHEGFNGSTQFSPAVQDQLADQLLEEAGISQVLNGHMTVQSFQNNLAKIWAGLPLENGRSYYQGLAGNKATISRSRFDTAMKQIFSG